MFFFFKQKTAYEMRISDWSSDVCSSDLKDAGVDAAVDRIARRIELGRQRRQTARQAAPKARQAVIDADLKDRRMIGTIGKAAGVNGVADRKSVVSGKSVSVRVDLGGSRIIKKKKLI